MRVWSTEPSIPTAIEAGTVPVHYQLRLAPLNVAATVGPPGPNCTVTLLSVLDQFDGTNSNEMFPAI